MVIMCQMCVTDGLMTEAELSQALAAGDKSIIPMMDLDPEDFAQELNKLMLESIARGISPDQAVAAGIDTAKAYVKARGYGPEVEATFLAQLDALS
jgi:hypothetical protein